MINPHAFGRKVARTQAQLTDETSLIRQAEKRLFDAESVTPPVQNSFFGRRLLIAASIAGLAFLTAILSQLSFSEPKLIAWIDGKQTEITTHLWVQSPASDIKSIQFSDGSHIELRAATRTRFIDVTEDGADMLVEQGRLAVNIIHEEKTRWRFFAGPFEVRVTGTRFELTWHQTEAFFSVEMTEGSVEISGPSLAENMEVRGGETFSAWLDENRTEFVANRADADPGGTEIPSLRGPETTRRDKIIASEKKDDVENMRDGADTVAPTTGATQSARLAEVSQNGSRNDICRSQNAGELLHGADKIRRDGNWRDAVSRYTIVRSCYRGTPEAALAAFNLGKIAFDQRKDWSDAIHWLKRYLSEQKGEGPVREAMGRLMEAYVEADRPMKARDVALQYLDAYPTGPHATYAEALIEEDADSQTHR